MAFGLDAHAACLHRRTKRWLGQTFVAIGLLCGSANGAAAEVVDWCDKAAASAAAVAVDEQAKQAFLRALESETRSLANPAWKPGYCRAVADNLGRKLVTRGEGVAFDGSALIRTAVKFEAFRIGAYRSSGVAPKLYFGFLDGEGRTTAYEKEVLSVSVKVAPILNGFAERLKLGFAVTPKEIAVTQISEGGALLLTTAFAEVDKVHPVFGVGLDDYQIGFRRFPGLTEAIDRAFGTRIGSLGGTRADVMTFKETILGTAVMYLYAKEIAEKKRLAEKRPSLATLPLDEQFVASSLVYNSGILFSDERVRQILAFDTAAYLVDISNRSAPRRPHLPVKSPVEADAWLATGSALPEQPTSWNAVYHVLQRYGAWVALSRFSDIFTPDGAIAGMRE